MINEQSKMPHKKTQIYWLPRIMVLQRSMWGRCRTCMRIARKCWVVLLEWEMRLKWGRGFALSSYWLKLVRWECPWIILDEPPNMLHPDLENTRVKLLCSPLAVPLWHLQFKADWVIYLLQVEQQQVGMAKTANITFWEKSTTNLPLAP